MGKYIGNHVYKIPQKDRLAWIIVAVQMFNKNICLFSTRGPKPMTKLSYVE